MAKKNDKKDKKKVLAAKKKATPKAVKKAAPKKAAKPAAKKAAAKKPAPKAKPAAAKKAAAPAKKAAPAKPAPKAAAAKPAPKAAAPKPAAKPVPKAKAKKEDVKPAAAAAKAPEPAVEEVADENLEAAGEETAEEVVLTDAEGRRYCRTKDCDQLSAVDGYCRYHYLLFWKKIQVRKKILSEGKLERYIEELTARYPDKFLDMLRKDLKSEKEFLSAIQELEIDESAVDSEFEDESANYIEEVRGMGEGGGSRDEEDF